MRLLIYCIACRVSGVRTIWKNGKLVKFIHLQKLRETMGLSQNELRNYVNDNGLSLSHFYLNGGVLAYPVASSPFRVGHADIETLTTAYAYIQHMKPTTEFVRYCHCIIPVLCPT